MSTTVLSRVALLMAVPPVRLRSQNRKESIMICLPTRFKSQRLRIEQFGKKSSTNVGVRSRFALSICAAALSATCCSSQSQTATIKKPTSTIAHAPIRDPIIDDGGYGFPPFNGGGGGGGGGGEGPFSGGFFLFLFLAILDFLKEKMEKKSEYQE